MVHQSLATRPAVPSRTVPPETHPTPDVLDVFGSRDNVIRAHFQRVLGLSAPAMIADNGFWITFIAAIFLAPLLETLMSKRPPAKRVTFCLGRRSNKKDAKHRRFP